MNCDVGLGVQSGGLAYGVLPTVILSVISPAVAQWRRDAAWIAERSIQTVWRLPLFMQTGAT